MTLFNRMGLAAAALTLCTGLQAAEADNVL